MSVAILVYGLILWCAESKELPWNHPVHVTIFYLLVVLIILYIKCIQRKPTCFDSELQSLQTVQQGLFVGTWKVKSISKRFEFNVFKGLIGFLC